MPQLGESIAEATVVRLPFSVGDQVVGDAEIIEVETNKATMGVTAPCSGRVAELLVELQGSYPVGATLGWLEVSEDEAARLGLDVAVPAPSDHATGSTPASSTPATQYAKATVEPTVRGLPVPAHAAGAGYLSPRLKARMNELGMHAADLAGIPGSGAAGRVTIEDFEKFIAKLDDHQLSQASTMRVAVADAMRRSWTRPLATVGMSVPIEELLAHRKAANPKPGPALYALRALAIALGENSAPAGRLIGDKIVHPKAIDVGFAVEAEDGVLVPVLRGADHTPLAQMVTRYNELVDLARQRRLPPNAQGGSIATVTNFGTFGLEWATPIPLPEQTLVLGMGAGRVCPHWDKEKGQFLPVTEAHFTLSFDHRVLDGGGAGRLLQRIAALLQEPEKL
ncbi:catalytic domain of component of various dehydrogenase complexes [Chthoniobacter flavus Ellin428]|uniref:Dihydrolipoamide acetyltransferase component of pyruvate dehydrogenase complex n=1 Tax=Chthoniobacter flavus Ellin428 TaxID=497964 RepID=B4DC30_9BACT|nr:2-oxo acid dehydrogenase subunit E2 [Chthoniobacter flavus]EDY16004.1 catalytic domain of component of various dehydrogenase complexes [Chthoniobacter flavus Ellin428]TCO85262.1 pyruvate dehydrogenase E2 component (dihydrolipoamide acetyltransferase) [Chthoniobacter flavus]